jgi:hypothetical protein
VCCRTPAKHFHRKHGINYQCDHRHTPKKEEHCVKCAGTLRHARTNRRQKYHFLSNFLLWPAGRSSNSYDASSSVRISSNTLLRDSVALVPAQSKAWSRVASRKRTNADKDSVLSGLQACIQGRVPRVRGTYRSTTSSLSNRNMTRPCLWCLNQRRMASTSSSLKHVYSTDPANASVLILHQCFTSKKSIT